ncbi:MAG: TetR/AcrR family transcriptional regulator [Dehalococcoidia bacterium]
MAIDKREALLAAAERAILAEGFAGASTRRIAQEAGVPLSLVHYHFGGKEGLLVALVERVRDRGHDQAMAVLADSGPPPAQAAMALAAARNAFSRDEAGARLLLEMAVAALHNDRLRVEVDHLYIEAITTLGRTTASTAGKPGNGRMSPEAAASLLLAAGFGLTLQRMLGVEERAADEAFDALGRMLVGAAPAHA